MNIEEDLIQRKREVDEALDRCLPQKKNLLIEAMRYSVFSGGKRLRPILTIATAELTGARKEEAIFPACAIELIHNFTLVHDDLPCMDDDDYRRGRATTHKVYGEGVAVLAGDALLNHAFMLIVKDTPIYKIDSKIKIRLLKEITEMIGADGLVGGQVEDILSEGEKVELSTLREIYKRKTATLFCLSIKIGALLGTTTEKEFLSLAEYGKHMGFAFQVIDDVIEVIQEKKQIKKVKPTYVSLVGVEEAKRVIREEILWAKERLNIFGPKAKVLFAIADCIGQMIA